MGKDYRQSRDSCSTSEQNLTLDKDIQVDKPHTLSTQPEAEVDLSVDTGTDNNVQDHSPRHSVTQKEFQDLTLPETLEELVDNSQMGGGKIVDLSDPETVYDVPGVIISVQDTEVEVPSEPLPQVNAIETSDEPELQDNVVENISQDLPVDTTAESELEDTVAGSLCDVPSEILPLEPSCENLPLTSDPNLSEHWDKD